MGKVSTTTHEKQSAGKKSTGKSSRTVVRLPDIHPLDRAIAELKKELARSPDDAVLLARLGALYYRRGDLLNAEAKYRQALEFQPHRASYRNNLGNILCDMGRFQEGIQCYEQAIAIVEAQDNGKMSSAEARANLELAKLEYRLIHERIAYFEQAVSLDVGSAEAYNALGCGYLLRDDRAKALETFRNAVSLDPRNLHAALNIGFTHTLDLSGSHDLSGALSELAAFAVRFPGVARLHLHQGELLEAAGLWDEAEDKYRRALQADPRCLEAYDLLGRLREVLGDDGDDRTSRIVQAAIEQLQNTEAKEEATAKLDEALSVLSMHRYEGIAAYDERIDALLREALRLSYPHKPEDVETIVKASVLRAQLLESNGRRDDAILVLETWCERLPGSGRLWFERGGVAFRNGDIVKAIEAFERSTVVEPQEAYAYRSLKFSFEGYRRYRTQRIRFEAAVKMQPEDAVAHYRFALAALGVLKDDEALFHFTRALDLDPKFAEAACGRGKTLQRQGYLKEAETAYRKALQLNPANAEAAQALQTIRLQQMEREADTDDIYSETI